MKRFFDIKLILLLVVLLTANIFYGCTTVTVDKVCANNLDAKILNYNDVKDSLIRFHVIANSDSDEDQQLKLKVKNKVIEYLYPYLSESKSLDDSRQIIKDNMDEVKTLTQEVIKEEGYNSGNARFSVMMGESSNLKGVYCAFGKITEGLEVLEKIYNEASVVENEDADEESIQEFSSMPVITNVTIEKYGVEYKKPEIHEAFDIQGYINDLYSSYYSN